MEGAVPLGAGSIEILCTMPPTSHHHKLAFPCKLGRAFHFFTINSMFNDDPLPPPTPCSLCLRVAANKGGNGEGSKSNGGGDEEGDGEEEGNGKGVKGDGDGNKGGRR